MRFKVLNRFSAQEYSKQKDIPKTIIISITDPDMSDNMFEKNDQIVDILRLKFADVDWTEYQHMTKEDGQKVIDFVNKYIDIVEQIVVHCEGGVSRSAGVCAALMKIIKGDDWEIFDNGHFAPNMTCYRAVIEAYFGEYSEGEAANKIIHNIKMWRKVNGLDD